MEDIDDKGLDVQDSLYLPVSFEDHGLRLDKFLAKYYDDLSRNRLQALIREGCVFQEGDQAVHDASMKIKEGQRFRITLPPPIPARPIAQDIPLSILYEDEHLLVLDKPGGMVVHPAPGHYEGTLVNALLHHCGESLQGIGGVARPGIVHRIDKDTSGLLVVAKTEKAHAGLAEGFATHSIDRVYEAVILGVPEPVRGTIDANLARHPKDRLRFTTVSEGRGKTAITHYHVKAQSRLAVSHIECRLETGRTHQIRVHFSSQNHPLVGDPLYAKTTQARRGALPAHYRTAIAAFPRQALHARTLGFSHPITRERLEFDSPLPEDMQKLLFELGLS